MQIGTQTKKGCRMGWFTHPIESSCTCFALHLSQCLTAGVGDPSTQYSRSSSSRAWALWWLDASSLPHGCCITPTCTPQWGRGGGMAVVTVVARVEVEVRVVVVPPIPFRPIISEGTTLDLADVVGVSSAAPDGRLQVRSCY
jgi:hypothetical protein